MSIAPETVEANLAEYTKTVTSANIVDYTFKAKVLEIIFSDGSTYEYFDVPHNLYNKLLNSDIPGRFFRRNIFDAFVYRKTVNPVTE